MAFLQFRARARDRIDRLDVFREARKRSGYPDCRTATLRLLKVRARAQYRQSATFSSRGGLRSPCCVVRAGKWPGSYIFMPARKFLPARRSRPGFHEVTRSRGARPRWANVVMVIDLACGRPPCVSIASGSLFGAGLLSPGACARTSEPAGLSRRRGGGGRKDRGAPRERERKGDRDRLIDRQSPFDVFCEMLAVQRARARSVCSLEFPIAPVHTAFRGYENEVCIV